ncbi:MAG: hypothetical protein JNK82_14680 [Myxococcaceae bacterium]|nr:hypothetical protein [Myxococcaceae bacterium]
MKTTITSMLAAAVLMTGAVAFAEETVPEKAKAGANDVKRSGRKAVNRTEESLCMGTKAECAKKKVKNRANETKDAVKDEADQLENKVD